MATSNETKTERKESQKSMLQQGESYHEPFAILEKRLPALNEELDHKEETYFKLQEQLHDINKQREENIVDVWPNIE